MALTHFSILIALIFSRLIQAAPTEHALRVTREDQQQPQVDLGYAVYEGTGLGAGVNQFLGIQYGAPPLGNLRWRAPQDPNVNRTVQQATKFAPTCLGLFGPIEVTKHVNEDCLYLDVFAPSSITADSKLPVWFFIQGGGYAGNTDENFNFTEVIIKSNHSIVGVQINYRVGVFGWLASEEIRQNGDLNVGLLDQRKALHWVQQYIHLVSRDIEAQRIFTDDGKFGGDPKHVVIHGDSAGAGSVAYHMTAYNGRNDNLFVGGMMESPFWPTHRTVDEMEFQYKRFAANVSCSPSEALGGDVLACLRSKDTKQLQASDVVSTFPDGTGPAEWYFLPVIDGTFSADYLYSLFELGRVVPVPLLVGDDTDEGTGFSPNATNSTQFLDFIKDNFPKLSDANLQVINETYPKNGFGSFPMHADYFAATETAYGEATFICPGVEVSHSLTKYNTASQVWNYRFNVQIKEIVESGYGIPHVSEKPAIWGPGNSGPCSSDGTPCSFRTYNAPIVPILMDYWISFIVALDPNTHKNAKAPEWQPWNNGGSCLRRLKLQINDTVMEDVPSAQLSRCDLWKSLADITQQ